MHQGTRQIDRLQHRCRTQAYSFKASKTEVKETTEFNGITLSPGFGSSANWDAGKLCKWADVQMWGI